MAEVRLSIAPLDAFFADAIEAARRIDSGARRARPAEITFESMDGLLAALTPNRWRLLRALRSAGPSSIRALAQRLERDYRGVHADVQALIAIGLIARVDDGKVGVPWTRIVAEMALDAAA